MDSKELQEVLAPRQLGDSHTLDFPREGEMEGVFFASMGAKPTEVPPPEDFVD